MQAKPSKMERIKKNGRKGKGKKKIMDLGLPKQKDSNESY
jgi:hypothetical protein